MSLADILAQSSAKRREDGRAELRVQPGETWQQGRTTYGGMSTALGYHCAQAVSDDLPPLRSYQVSFVGPMAGALRFTARLLRRGRNASWVAVEGADDKGGTGFAATYLFMGPVESSTLHINDYAAPSGVSAPDEAEIFDSPFAPTFIKHHFEARMALPWREGTAELCWWVRFKTPNMAASPPADPMAELACIADTLPPGVLPALGLATPVSSMTWQANLLTAQPETEDGWWLMRSRADYAEAGCSSQQMMMWNRAGEAVLSGMQSVAVFG